MDVYYGTMDVKKFQYTYIIYIPKAWGIKGGDQVYVEYAPLGTEDWTKDMRRVFSRGTGVVLTLNKSAVQDVKTVVVKLVKVDEDVAARIGVEEDPEALS